MSKKKGIIGIGIAVLIAAIVIIGVLMRNMGKQSDFNYITSKDVAENIKEKYAESEKYIYEEPIILESRSEAFELDIKFDTKAANIQDWYEICALYQDPELLYEIVPNFTHDRERQKIVIAPTRYPIGLINASEFSTDEINRYEHSGDVLFPKDEACDWGNIGTMYLAIYRNLETGEILEKPIVKVVIVEGEIKENPVVEFSVTEDGRARFEWEEVEGASEYVICKVSAQNNINESFYGMKGYANAIAITSDNSWQEEAPEYGVATMNNEFMYYSVDEDEWKDEAVLELLKERYGDEAGVYRTEFSDYEYCVIAINENGTSMMSNTISLKHIAENLPYSYAHNTAKEKNSISTRRESINDMPLYQYITMCDGYTAEKLINYKTEQAKVLVERWAVMDEAGNVIGLEDVSVLHIPTVVEGTSFEDEMYVPDYDDANLLEDLKFLEEREAGIRKKAGDVRVSANLSGDDVQDYNGKVNEQAMNYTVTANSALSEYLARNMLAGVEKIDLTNFPESASEEILYDAWTEAFYQNPLILGVKGYSYNKKESQINVVYDDVESQNMKQQALEKKVAEIVDSIITSEMSDLEKEFAINQYLCDYVEHDEEAVENAKANNYEMADDEFKDSYTAYGALINGKCVCAGYASAFKLLAEEAGLDSLVVTGMLEGNINHAWNKVKIDGEWQVVDVTNNDLEYITNALLNLSNSAGDKVLIEDKDYVLDEVLTDYVAAYDKNEYYRVKNMYYSYEEIVDKLAADLKDDGRALLRTEYELDDDIFAMITDSLYDKLEADTKLRGYYWMGVIYLKVEQ